MTLRSWKVLIHDTGGPTVTVTLSYSFKEPFRPERGRVVRRKNVFRDQLEELAQDYIRTAVHGTLEGLDRPPSMHN